MQFEPTKRASKDYIRTALLLSPAAEEEQRTVCVTPQGGRWGLQSRRWSAVCHPSLWGPRTNQQCVWPLQAELWCSPPPQDHREGRPARPIKHISAVWFIPCGKKKQKNPHLNLLQLMLLQTWTKKENHRGRGSALVGERVNMRWLCCCCLCDLCSIQPPGNGLLGADQSLQSASSAVHFAK